MASDHAFGLLGVVAEEFGAADFVQHARTIALSVAASPEPAQAARASAFCFSIAAAKPSGVDGDAAGAQRILRQVEREAVGVVELERDIAVEPVARCRGRRWLRRAA